MGTCPLPDCSFFRSGRSLVMAHFREKHFKRFRCKKCGVKAATEARLVEHVEIHLGLKGRTKDRVVCEVCSKSISRPSFLRHMRIHEGGTLYKCGLCESAFSTRSVLREHSWNVHGKEFDGVYETVQNAPKLNISSALERKTKTESVIQKWVSEGLVTVRPPITVYSKLGQQGGRNADRKCNCAKKFSRVLP